MSKEKLSKKKVLSYSIPMMIDQLVSMASSISRFETLLIYREKIGLSKGLIKEYYTRIGELREEGANLRKQLFEML